MFIDSRSISVGQRLLKAFLVAMILFMLSFIFIHSTLPPEVVERESEIASDIVSEVISPEGAVGEYTENNMDKIAHFTEFGLLGLFVSMYVCGFAVRPLLLSVLSLLFSGAVATIDETIQIFSGRTPDMRDALFDMAGFALVSLLIYIAYFAFIRSKKKR